MIVSKKHKLGYSLFEDDIPIANYYERKKQLVLLSPGDEFSYDTFAEVINRLDFLCTGVQIKTLEIQKVEDV